MEAAGNFQAHFHPMIYFPLTVPDDVLHHHSHAVDANQACSVMVQIIHASLDTTWSVVRQFDNPRVYKSFVRSCRLIDGDGGVGTLREVEVVTGVPKSISIERLEILNDEKHVISFRVVGGEHRLQNYRSVTTLHATEDENETVVVESYVVDVPDGNTKEETCIFADTIVRCNLRSLARVVDNL